jgi:hypothetical protein
VRKIKYVFLSYSSANAQDAEALKALMEKGGISVWMAPHEISFGESFADIIPPAIEKCACFVLLLTEEAQRSSWVPKELDQAIHLQKPIIPVQRKEIPLTNAFQFSLIDCQILTMQTLDITNPQAPYFLTAVKSAMAGKLRKTRKKAPRHPSTTRNKAFVIVGVAIVVLCFVLFAGSIFKQIFSFASNSSPFGTLFDSLSSLTSDSNNALPTPSPTDINQIPDFLEAEVNELRYANAPTVHLMTKTVKVGAYISLPSAWDNYVIYSENTNIALPEGNLVKGISPGSTYVVKAAAKNVCTVYLIIVEE